MRKMPKKERPIPDYRFFDNNDDLQLLDLDGLETYAWKTPEEALVSLRKVAVYDLKNLPWTLQKCQVEAVIHHIPAKLRVVKK
jgi:hypothetical protein